MSSTETDRAMMADCVGFQAQIASIIELLANSAVAEICKLVDEGYAALRAQVEREREESGRENDALRRKLREMDERMRGYERRMRRRNQRDETHAVGFRPAEGSEDQHLLVPPPPPPPPPPTSSEDKGILHISKPEETKMSPLVKQERPEPADCNLDLKVEVNVRSESGLSTALEPGDEPPGDDSFPDTSVTNIPSATGQHSSSPTDVTVDPASRSRVKRKSSKPPSNSATISPGGVPAPEAASRDLGGTPTEEPLKPEVLTGDAAEEELPSQLSAPVASEEHSPDRLNSLGLDLAWVQERVNHLGAAYAVAQLGLGNTETGLPSASFPTQVGGDGLDGPPPVLYTGGPHEIAAFAASFDMAAAAAPPPAAAPPATKTAQRRPYRSSGSSSSSGSATKEAVVCAVCGRVFPSMAALELHQLAHTGERPYTCPHCAKGFAQPNNLRVHLLIHTGERRYRCSLCGKSFISSSHLKRHRTVHTQEKPYNCSRCGQSFSQMCSVRRHRQQSQCGL